MILVAISINQFQKYSPKSEKLYETIKIIWKNSYTFMILNLNNFKFTAIVFSTNNPRATSTV